MLLCSVLRIESESELNRESNPVLQEKHVQLEEIGDTQKHVSITLKLHQELVLRKKYLNEIGETQSHTYFHHKEFYLMINMNAPNVEMFSSNLFSVSYTIYFSFHV